MLLCHILSQTVSYSLLLDTLVAGSRPGQIVSLLYLDTVFFRRKYTVGLPPTCYKIMFFLVFGNPIIRRGVRGLFFTQKSSF